MSTKVRKIDNRKGKLTAAAMCRQVIRDMNGKGTLEEMRDAFMVKSQQANKHLARRYVINSLPLVSAEDGAEVKVLSKAEAIERDAAAAKA